MGIILKGLSNPDEEVQGVVIQRELDFPTVNIIEELNEFAPEDKEENDEDGDIFNAIELALENFEEKYKKLKWIKKIFIFTDGDSPCSIQNNKITKIANALNSKEIKINIIAINFFSEIEKEDKEEEDNEMKVDEDDNETDDQKNTKQAIKELMSLSENVKVFTSTMANYIYRQFRKKKVNPTTKFRGPLILTPNVSIDVAVYTKTYTQNLPSLKKYSLTTEYSDDPKAGGVTNERMYFIHDDPNRIPVDPSLITKAYYYGNSLVPVSKQDEVRFKNSEEKCLKAIGFTDSFRVPRHHFMAGVDLVIPNPESRYGDIEAFFGIVTEMIKANKVLIARYIFRANADPKLVVLTPHLSKKGPVFYLNALPTIEDIRDYQFDSLKQCSIKQEELVSKFIDSLDLEANDEEELKPNETYNPILQYFYQCLESKALGNENELPNLDEEITKYLIPSKALFENNKIVSFFPKMFEIKEKEKKNEKKKRVFWKEVIENEMNTALSEKKVEDKLNANKAEGKKSISTITPIEDFNEMIQNRTEDLTVKAMTLMKEMIETFILESFKGSYYIRAIECIKALRDAANEEDEVEVFNVFLQDMKKKFTKDLFLDFWLLFTDNNITLISKEENAKSTFSEKECQEWLNSMRKKEVITSTLQDIDNLLLDID